MHWTNAWYATLWPESLDLPGTMKWGVEAELAHCITPHSDHFAEFLLPDPTNLGSAGLEDMKPNGTGEGKQQREASSCVHCKGSIKAEAGQCSLIPVEQ